MRKYKFKFIIILAVVILVILPSFYAGFLFFNLSKSVMSQPDFQELVSLKEPDETRDSLKEITICSVGDIMLARKVGRIMEARGKDYPFLHTTELLNEADITFGNLECSVSERGRRIPGKNIWFRADPAVVPELKNSGFDILSLANNHSLDYDREAFLDTEENLTEYDIAAIGGGENIEAAREPHIVDMNDIKIGFLAYSGMADVIWSADYPITLKAEDQKPGIAPLDPEIILEDIKELKDRVDLVILSLHWGTEYAYAPSREQRDMAHNFIDNGADVILGHHPHVIQGVEVYKQGIVAYSLGNFIFDQNHRKDTCEGIAFSLKLNKLGISEAEIRPLIIYEDSQPRFAENERAEAVAKRFKRYSEQLGTRTQISNNPLKVKVYGK